MDAYQELLQNIHSVTGQEINGTLIEHSIKTIGNHIATNNDIQSHSLRHGLTLLKSGISHQDLSEKLTNDIVKKICCPLFVVLEQFDKINKANMLSIYKTCMERINIDGKLYVAQILIDGVSAFDNNALLNSVEDDEDKRSGDSRSSDSVNIHSLLDIISVYPAVCIVKEKELVYKIIDLLQHCADDIANKILFNVLSKILQQSNQGVLNTYLLQELWVIVCRLFRNSDLSCNTSRAYTILCGLSNWYLPGHCETEKSVYIIQDEEFWLIIQAGLYHSNPLKRKESLYMFKVGLIILTLLIIVILLAFVILFPFHCQSCLQRNAVYKFIFKFNTMVIKSIG